MMDFYFILSYSPDFLSLYFSLTVSVDVNQVENTFPNSVFLLHYSIVYVYRFIYMLLVWFAADAYLISSKKIKYSCPHRMFTLFVFKTWRHFCLLS